MNSSAKDSSVLPPGWANPLLCEVAQINPPLDRCIIDNDLLVNFVPMRAVERDGGGLLRPEVRSFGKVKKGYTPFLSGDVIMAKITPCLENGKTAVVPQFEERVCFGSTEFHVIRPENGISAKWIANLLLRHDVRHAAQRQMSGGVGQMRVPSTFLETTRIPIPPVAEQQLIGDTLDELFSDLDAAVEALERTRKKLILYRASILKAAVEGVLTAEWRAQHPNTEPASVLLERILAERRRRWEEEQLSKFKEKGKEPPENWKSKYKEPVAPNVEKLEQQPEGWGWARLDQLLWQLRSGTGETSGKVPTDYPVLKSSAVRPGRIDFHELNFLDASQSRYRENFLEQGDFLITRLSGSVEYVGCSAVVEDIRSSGIQYPDRIFCGKLVFEELGVYLTYCFQHARIRKCLENSAKSTAGHQRISMSDLYPLIIALPPRDELNVIVEAVEHQLSVITHTEADLDSMLKAAKSLRQSILRHAFEGKLVPQDPNDEPASELLKRIAVEREERAREAAAAKAANTKVKKSRKHSVRAAKTTFRRTRAK